MNPLSGGGRGGWVYLKVIALLNKEVQSVLQLLEHRPLQEGLSLAKSLQTVCLAGHPHIQIYTNAEER